MRRARTVLLVLFVGTFFASTAAAQPVKRVGRFTTVDPVTDLDASLIDPQRWHRYSYALNGPQKQVDTDGHETPVRIGGHLSGLGLEAVRTSSEGGVKTLIVFAGITVGSLSVPAVVSSGAAMAGGCLVSPACQQTALDVLEDVAGGVGKWFSGGKVDAALANQILNAERVGSGLKADAGHRAASWVTAELLQAGRAFSIKGP